MSAPLGKASLALAVIPFLLNTCMWGLIFAAIASDPHWGNDRSNSMAFSIMGTVMLLGLLCHLVGVGTGIASLVKGESGRGFAIGGLALNGLFLIGACLLGVMSYVFRGV